MLNHSVWKIIGAVLFRRIRGWCRTMRWGSSCAWAKKDWTSHKSKPSSGTISSETKSSQLQQQKNHGNQLSHKSRQTEYGNIWIYPTLHTAASIWISSSGIGGFSLASSCIKYTKMCIAGHAQCVKCTMKQLNTSFGIHTCKTLINRVLDILKRLCGLTLEDGDSTKRTVFFGTIDKKNQNWNIVNNILAFLRLTIFNVRNYALYEQKKVHHWTYFCGLIKANLRMLFFKDGKNFEEFIVKRTKLCIVNNNTVNFNF